MLLKTGGRRPGAARAAPHNPDHPVFIRHAAWEALFCRGVRAAMTHGDASPGEIFDAAFVVNRAVRDVLDVDVDDATLAAVEQRIAAVRADVAAYFGLPLTGSEGPGFLRYGAGGLYRRHLDRAPGEAVAGDRLVSVVVFLNGAEAGERGADAGFAGGTLRLYPSADGAPLDVIPQAGLLVAFPADMPHEVLPVTDGTRDTVVDWFV